MQLSFFSQCTINRNGLGRFCFVLCLSAIVISGIHCTPSEPLTQLQGEAQGSTYTIQFVGPEPEGLHDQIKTLLRDIDLSMSTYVPESIISQVNRAKGEWTQVDPLFDKVLRTSLDVSRETDGAFDPTVGRLVRLWGFDFEEIKGDVTPDDIREALALTGFSRVEYEAASINVRLPDGFALDFNSIAQGFTVDTLALLLEAKGFSNYLVEVGGELRARGVNAQSNTWTIGIDKPTTEQTAQRDLAAIVALNNKSMATSGNYRKFWVDPSSGLKYAHTIDPRTGRPAMNQLLSATIIHSESMIADAYATACMVWGTDQCIDFIENHEGFSAYLIYANESGEWMTYESEGLNIRLIE
jgi:thiamine biosynthesis lipoprotein